MKAQLYSPASYASEKEIEILSNHYQVPDIELSSPCMKAVHSRHETEIITANGWRITLRSAVEPLAEKPGSWGASL